MLLQLTAELVLTDPAVVEEWADLIDKQVVDPLVWASSEREGFVDSVQGMRRRVTENIPARELPRQLKLGPGGLRDVEFAVQLMQLVHGRTDGPTVWIDADLSDATGPRVAVRPLPLAVMVPTCGGGRRPANDRG